MNVGGSFRTKCACQRSSNALLFHELFIDREHEKMMKKHKSRVRAALRSWLDRFFGVAWHWLSVKLAGSLWNGIKSCVRKKKEDKMLCVMWNMLRRPTDFDYRLPFTVLGGRKNNQPPTKMSEGKKIPYTLKIERVPGSVAGPREMMMVMVLLLMAFLSLTQSTSFLWGNRGGFESISLSLSLSASRGGKRKLTHRERNHRITSSFFLILSPTKIDPPTTTKRNPKSEEHKKKLCDFFPLPPSIFSIRPRFFASLPLKKSSNDTQKKKRSLLKRASQKIWQPQQKFRPR